ncbi:threonine aldolase family protein [Marilutibacter chinensis]|uniref:Beta-eliminating lyase-related protein n=1 Tax=Marilutibacter chinensis TaxID=2912247 RepID=A0ABS9HV98_9GAMM|nr:beta-eliminating lyase-related protein [Lysobacter chinensis]MCF7222643.1 beta-eliminating lyase-related protein [Lysobacter chinensis]
MDRRQFLGSTGLTALAPALGLVSGAGVDDETGSAPELFREVNFFHDGLGMSPREYATLLQRMTQSDGLVGDNYSNGGAIGALERTFAQRLGKEAAMFVPTGTLANHLALRRLAGNDRRVLVQAESHFYCDSGDCGELLSGLNLIPLAEGRTAFTVEEVRRWVERSGGGRVPTGVGAISIESPVRRRDHESVDFDEMERVCRYARAQGIRLHLDGARLFNLPYHSGRSVREYAALFDTVFVSLWKHFNAMSGAILAGDASFIDGLYHVRRMFGGSLPQAWPVAAVAAEYVDRYEDVYAQSWRAMDRLIAMLESNRRLRFRKLPNGTSRFFLSVEGVAPQAVVTRAARRGVRLPWTNASTGEFAMQVNPTVLRMPPEALAEVFEEAVKA